MQKKPIGDSLQEYGRGLIGGLIFSLPLLFTMEVWVSSYRTSPVLLLLNIALTYALLLGYNAYAGLRENASWKEVAIDSVEEMGIGLVLAFLFLLLLGLIDFDTMSLERIVYMVITEALTVAIGVSIGTAQLGTSANSEEVSVGMQETSAQKKDKGSSTLELVVLSVCAGMLLASNIAPTDEVFLLATSIKPLLVLGIVLVSLVLNGIILFYIGFRGAYETPAQQKPHFMEVLWNVSITYGTAFCVSAGALWFYGRFEGEGFHTGVQMTVILSLVASLGASAGRLLLDQEANPDVSKTDNYEKEPA
ncbi:DUF2391 family protein [Rufibacter sp. DG15C]|uniref:DUF2391 family protein n=1 Tax=Rufibacter sp. DG15C TaxID=1379909 RepID=UPI00082F6126|nr:DUF2391 family protein [Rufibacter sp. DG15C]